MMSVSVISFLALTFGVPYCEKKRKVVEDFLITEAAIEAAFEVEIITPDCREEVAEHDAEEDAEGMAFSEGYIQVESSYNTDGKRIFSV